MAKVSPILFVGLNPAWQQIMVCQEVCAGKVNRARLWQVAPGGKGVHAARAANTLWPGSGAAVFFAGGSTGEDLVRMLSQLGVAHVVRKVASSTRTCITVIDEATGEATELIAPTSAVEAEDVDALSRDLAGMLATSAGLAICGTAPPGVPVDFYERLIKGMGEDRPVVVDAYREIRELLMRIRVDVLKINMDELCDLTGCGEPESAVKRWRAAPCSRMLAVTNGSEAAYLFSDKAGWRFSLPRLPAIRNPIGAGDTCTGVLTVRMALAGDDVLTAFRHGLAAASASCLELEGAHFSSGSYREIFERITISPVEHIREGG